MAEANCDKVESKLSTLNIDDTCEKSLKNDSTTTQIDGRSEGTVNGSEVALPPGYVFSHTKKDDEVYSMKYKKRGYCVIFNHKNFDYKLSLGERNGTDKDRDSVRSLFDHLGFTVEVFNDATLKRIETVVKKYAYNVDHSDCDCFIMVFMSHGEEQILWAKDDNFKPDVLFEHFTADNCPSLSAKPKMFFIQACRGEGLDQGTKIANRNSIDQTDSGYYSIYTVPNHADFLVCWSTVPGHYSWRNTTNGSWFIQSLVYVFRNYSHTTDVLSMMTMVNRYLILNFESNCPTNPGMHKKKQSMCLVSTLMRQMYLRPKEQ